MCPKGPACIYCGGSGVILPGWAAAGLVCPRLHGRPELLAAVQDGLRQLRAVEHPRCWSCKAEVPGGWQDGDTCPSCGVDLLPF